MAPPAADLNSILVGFFFSCLDAAIVATSLVSISKDLGEFFNIHWAILAYLLSYMGKKNFRAQYSVERKA